MASLLPQGSHRFNAVHSLLPWVPGCKGFLLLPATSPLTLFCAFPGAGTQPSLPFPIHSFLPPQAAWLLEASA